MNLRFKFSLALILLMMLGSLTSFLIPYTQAKNRINYYEEIANFYSDNLVRPSSNLLRNNIEENHKYFEAITFTALDDKVKKWHITNLARSIHLLITNTHEFIRLSNDEKSAFISPQKKESLHQKLTDIKKRSIHNIKLFYQFNEDDLSFIENPHKSISRERQKELRGKLRPDIYNLDWIKITKVHDEASEDFRKLEKVISGFSAEFYETTLSLHHAIKLEFEEAIKYILAFGVIQSIFYLLLVYLDWKYGNVKNLPTVNKSSFYLSSVIFYLFIPASILLYLNEFQVEQNKLEISKNLTFIEEGQEITQDLKRIRNVIEKFYFQHDFFISLERNLETGKLVIETPLMSGITSYLKFLNMNPSTEISVSVDNFPLTKRLIQNEYDTQFFDDIDGRFSDLNLELNEIGGLLGQKWLNLHRANNALGTKNEKINTFSLGLLVGLTFIEIIGSLVFVSYIIPRKQ